MKELIARWTNESPKFFKKIIALGLILGGIGTTILATPESTLNFPAWIDAAAEKMVWIGGIVAIVAKFTVADASVLPKEEPKA